MSKFCSSIIYYIWYTIVNIINLPSNIYTSYFLGYFDIEKDKFTINGTYKTQTYHEYYADPNKAYTNHLMIISGNSSNDYYQYVIVKSNY